MLVKQLVLRARLHIATATSEMVKTCYCFGGRSKGMRVEKVAGNQFSKESRTKDGMVTVHTATVWEGPSLCRPALKSSLRRQWFPRAQQSKFNSIHLHICQVSFFEIILSCRINPLFTEGQLQRITEIASLHFFQGFHAFQDTYGISFPNALGAMWLVLAKEMWSGWMGLTFQRRGTKMTLPTSLFRSRNQGGDLDWDCWTSRWRDLRLTSHFKDAHCREKSFRSTGSLHEQEMNFHCATVVSAHYFVRTGFILANTPF